MKSTSILPNLFSGESRPDNRKPTDAEFARSDTVLNAEQAVDRTAAVKANSGAVKHLTTIASRDVFLGKTPAESVNQLPDNKFVEIVPEVKEDRSNTRLTEAGLAVANAFDDRVKDAA